MITELGFIYALQHPETGEIFYIGSTESSLKHRLKTHYLHLRQYERGIRNGNKRYEYLLKLLPLKARIVLLKIVQNDDLDNWEILFIKQMREFYPDLTNMTDGGRGQHTSKYYTEKQMEAYSGKLSKGNTGKVRSQEFKDNLSKQRTGFNNPGCRILPFGGMVCLHPDGPILFRHSFQLNKFCNSKHASSNIRKYFRTGLPYGYSWEHFDKCSQGIQDIVQSHYESNESVEVVNSTV